MLSGFFLVRQEMSGTFFFKPFSELRKLRILQILITLMVKMALSFTQMPVES